MNSTPVAAVPITDDDIDAVAAFLHHELNPRVSAAAWAAAMVPPWSGRLARPAPNHGFLLRHGSEVVGAYLAIYSTRTVAGREHDVCNLAGWCVRDDHRDQALRLVRALVRQPGYTFTDLSPSGNVPEIDRRLGFTDLDTTTTIQLNLTLGSWRWRILTDAEAIAARLSGPTAQIFADHRDAPAVIAMLAIHDRQQCLVLARLDRRKGLPLFGTVLWVSDRTAFRRCGAALARHLLLRHRVPFTLAEVRTVGRRPALALRLSRSRPKLFRSAELTADQIDDLYSELVCLRW